MKNLLVAAALALAACGAAQTHNLHIENGWASPTPGGVDVSAGYFTIVNDSDEADRLLAASSPRAARIELHNMNMEGAVMQMRMSGPLAVAAHDRLSLAPGGTHLMFTGVRAPFREGERIPVQLTFERAGAVGVELPVFRSAPQHHP